MRRRYQQGSLRKVDGNWIAQWWEDGHRRKRTLGRVSTVKKAQAQAALDAIRRLLSTIGLLPLLLPRPGVNS